MNGLQDADRWSEIRGAIGARGEKAIGGDNREEVVSEGRDRQQEESIANRRPRCHEAILLPLSLAEKHHQNADAHEQNAEPPLRRHALAKKELTSERAHRKAESRGRKDEADFGERKHRQQ